MLLFLGEDVVLVLVSINLSFLREGGILLLFWRKCYLWGLLVLSYFIRKLDICINLILISLILSIHISFLLIKSSRLIIPWQQWAHITLQLWIRLIHICTIKIISLSLPSLSIFITILTLWWNIRHCRALTHVASLRWTFPIIIWLYLEHRGFLLILLHLKSALSLSIEHSLLLYKLICLG